jgi:hypothetical protein
LRRARSAREGAAGSEREHVAEWVERQRRERLASVRITRDLGR